MLSKVSSASATVQYALSSTVCLTCPPCGHFGNKPKHRYNDSIQDHIHPLLTERETGCYLLRKSYFNCSPEELLSDITQNFPLIFELEV